MRLETLDQAGVDQEPVEAARLCAVRTAVEQAAAALEDSLLLGERGIKRDARAFQRDERKIRRLDHVERGWERERPEIDRVDGVVGRKVADVVGRNALRNLF